MNVITIICGMVQNLISMILGIATISPIRLIEGGTAMFVLTRTNHSIAILGLLLKRPFWSRILRECTLS